LDQYGNRSGRSDCVAARVDLVCLAAAAAADGKALVDLACALEPSGGSAGHRTAAFAEWIGEGSFGLLAGDAEISPAAAVVVVAAAAASFVAEPFVGWNTVVVVAGVAVPDDVVAGVAAALPVVAVVGVADADAVVLDVAAAAAAVVAAAAAAASCECSVHWLQLDWLEQWATFRVSAFSNAAKGLAR
jgi:hypothetical protein